MGDGAKLRPAKAMSVGAWALRAALALLALWIAVRLLGLERGYPLVALLSFTPYAACMAVLALAVTVAVRRRAEMAVAAVIVIAFALAVLPRAFPSQPADAPENGVPLSVLTNNLHLGDADADALVGLAERVDADVLTVQELTEGAVKRLRGAGVDELFPHQVLGPVPAGGAGAGIYSRYPLEEAPPVEGGISRQVRATLDVPGAAPIEIVSVHPFPPNSTTTPEWEEALELLPRPDEEVVRILSGDFNATFDHDLFRELVESGYVDAAAARGQGLVMSWPVEYTTRPRVAIDHVLADERVHVSAVEIVDLSGSDHRAVSARLLLPPGHG